MESISADKLEEMLFQAAKKHQQNNYELSSDFVRFEPDEYDYLKSYIGYALFGYPIFKQADSEEETKNETVQNNCTGRYVWPKEQQEIVDMIYEKVMRYGTWPNSGGIILCGIIYNVIYNAEQVLQQQKEKEKKNENEPQEALQKYKEKKNEKEPQESCPDSELMFYPVPIFKVRCYIQVESKVTNKYSKYEEKTYYIENSGRVYKDFDEYLTSNILPECTMVFPKDGKYQIDPECCDNAICSKENEDEFITQVWLEVRESPACSLGNKLLFGADIVNTVVSVGGMGLMAASMVTPVGPTMMLAGGVSAGISGAWTFGRSVQNLADRGTHDESLTDRNAVGSWIGATGSLLSIAASGGTALLTRAAHTGATVSRAMTVTYNSIVIGNLVINGIGIGFKGYDIYINYMEKDKIDPIDVCLLTAHIFFFGNSLMSMRFANEIIGTSQNQMLKEYEESLRSNRHRKAYRSIVRNTRINGVDDISANAEVIRGLNTINNKDEFFQAIVRNRKVFSATNAKVSFSDGKVTVNSVMTIDPIEFSSLPKDTRIHVLKALDSQHTGGTKPHNTAGTSSNMRAAGSNLPKFKKSTNEQKDNTTGKTPKMSSGSKTESSPTGAASNNPTASATQTAETDTRRLSYGFDIIRNFCSTNAISMPSLSGFNNILKDLNLLQISEAQKRLIFKQCLEIAFRIISKRLHAISERRCVSTGELLSDGVEFVWDVVMISLTMLVNCKLSSSQAGPYVKQLVQKLMRKCEEKLNEFIEDFKIWLKERYPEHFAVFDDWK